jgi:hypothetical protein
VLDCCDEVRRRSRHGEYSSSYFDDRSQADGAIDGSSANTLLPERARRRDTAETTQHFRRIHPASLQ